jgi:hypothetical protein
MLLKVHGAFIERNLMRQFAVVILCILLFISTSIAQSKMNEFSGNWLRDEIIQKEGRPLPRIIWQITFSEEMMVLTNKTQEGKVTRTVKYKLDGTETKETKPDMTHKFA